MPDVPDRPPGAVCYDPEPARFLSPQCRHGGIPRRFARRRNSRVPSSDTGYLAIRCHTPRRRIARRQRSQTTASRVALAAERRALPRLPPPSAGRRDPPAAESLPAWRTGKMTGEVDPCSISRAARCHRLSAVGCRRTHDTGDRSARASLRATGKLKRMQHWTILFAFLGSVLPMHPVPSPIPQWRPKQGCQKGVRPASSPKVSGRGA